MRAPLFALLLLGFTACSTVELSMQGRGVTLSRGGRVQRNLEGLEAIGEVSSSCGSRPTLRGNMETCQNDLRNQAAEKGGTLVILKERQMGRWFCEHCVKLTGTVYREKDAAPRAPANTLRPPRH